MKRAALLLMLAGCVDLSAPRAYQCDPQGLSLEEAVRQSNCRSTKSSTWYCALDGFCRDVTKPSTRECEADVHCPAQHRCLPTEDSMRVLRCRPVDQEGAFRCRPDAGDSDCGPASSCSFEGVCQPREARAFRCRPDAGDVDCFGGWRCGLDAVCRARVGGPNRCVSDFDCDEGWRCGGERCLDPRDEQLLPLRAPLAPIKVNPLVDFFGDGGGLLLVSPPIPVDGGFEQRVVFRDGPGLFLIKTGRGTSSINPVPVAMPLQPGAKVALGPATMVQAKGSLIDVVLLSPDAGVTTFDAGREVISARALGGPGLTFGFGFALDGGTSTSAFVITPGRTDELQFVPDSGVRLAGVTTYSVPGCAPSVIGWSATTLYLWRPDAGFTTGVTTTSTGRDLEHLAVDDLVEIVTDDRAVPPKRSILDVVSGDGAYVVTYEQKQPGASDGGSLAAGGASVRVAAVAPLGCGLVGLVTDVEACEGAPGAQVKSTWARASQGQPIDLVRSCSRGAIEFQYRGSSVRVEPRSLTAQSVGSFAGVAVSGVLGAGATPVSAAPLAAAGPIEAVFEEPVSRLSLFVSGNTYFYPAALGLQAYFTTNDPGSMVFGRLAFSRNTTILRSGLVVDRDVDGGVTFLAGMPEGSSISGAVFVPPNALVVTASDGLWTAPLDPATPTYLQLRARSLPGFPITSIALDAHPSGGAFQGFAVSANRLFSVDAPTLNRVNLTELPLTAADDPVQVWFDGPSGARRGRLLMRSGAVRSLPGLLTLAELPGRDVATEAISACDSTLQLTATGVFRLESPDGGTGLWRRIDGPFTTDAGLRFDQARLIAMDGGALVSFPGGAAWRLPLVCQ